ncbi:DUF6906 family protein [Paenibacillus sp. FSL H7-0714]|uniref:DUF6906 family protein n=1 Tax=Paenibacillus sp. FSL H7-0714 TaxID=2954735 RepID=UPI004046B4E8
MEKMKQGKRPTRRQKETIRASRLNPENWLVERETLAELVLIPKISVEGKTKKRTIRKGA